MSKEKIEALAWALRQCKKHIENAEFMMKSTKDYKTSMAKKVHVQSKQRYEVLVKHKKALEELIYEERPDAKEVADW
jgi:hypothetical protein